MFKNVATKIALFAFDTTTGAPKTGDAANITAYVSKDYGAVTVLADTTATEMDATNAKGWYLFDVAQAETNADALLFTGKSSTANISVVAQYIHTTPNRFSSLVIDAAGLADATAVKVGPSGAATAQTAGDIPARLPAALVSGRMDASVGAMASDTLTSSALAASAVTEIQSGLSTLDAAGVRSAVGMASANMDTQLSGINAKTSALPADPADASDIAASFSTVNSTLVTIAGYVDTEVAAIKAKTDNLPANPAAASDIPSAAAVADAVWDEAISGHLTSGTTGAGLNAAGSAGDPWSTALPGAYGAGTAGNIVGTALDATVSSRATQSSLNAVAGYVDTEVAAILSAVDTEVSAIKAKTDNLPAAPAAVGDIPTAIENADALLNRDMSAGTDSGSPTVRTVRQALRFLRNKWSISGTTLTVTKEDDATPSWTSTVSTSAGADPVTGSDPA